MSSLRYAHRASHSSTTDDHAPSSPGKSTLTARLSGRTPAEGAPLPAGVRARFEATLGADLGAVRVHTDADLAEAVAAEGAHALTYGQDIFFAPSRFAPDDPFGLHLLAHEVAHTVQQAGGEPTVQYKKPGASGDAKEAAADADAAAMVSSDPFDLGAQPAPKALPTAVMARLRADHAARRAKRAPQLAAAQASGDQAQLIAALKAAAPLFGIKLADKDLVVPRLSAPSTKPGDKPTPTAWDLSAFTSSAAWGEAELHLHLDRLPPELEADPGVKAAKAQRADLLAACAELAAEYEPLFASCRGVAAKLDLAQLVDAFVDGEGFGPILGDAFGGKAAITAAELSRLFSARQRALLWEYLTTKRLPDGLFTGSPNGAIEPGQRVLMASHMMVSGQVEIRSKTGEHTGTFHKGRADNCGHWAQMMWAYAAANPGTDFGGNHKKGNTGPTGETAFGTGSAQQIYEGKIDPSLRLEDRHADYMAKHPDEAKGVMGKRRTPMGPVVYDTLRAGDWIHVYNANASGTHSVIFAGWLDTSDRSAFDPFEGTMTYRAARIYHQYDNETGASDAGVCRIGTAFSLAHKIFPVTMVKRPSATAAPATTMAELLPFTAATAEVANLATLNAHKLDRERVATQLLASARKLVADLAALEPGQRALCQDILAKHGTTSLTDLTVQLALGQRLLREDNVDGKLAIYKSGPNAVTSTLLGKRPLGEFLK